MRARDVLAAAIGAGAALAVDRATVRAMPNVRVESAAAGLLGAATIYPLARRRSFGNLAEKTVLIGAVGVGAVAVAMPRRRRQIIGAGWIAHAAYDAAFHHDAAASRIPSWYPAMCAGYDVALGAALLLPESTA